MGALVLVGFEFRRMLDVLGSTFLFLLLDSTDRRGGGSCSSILSIHHHQYCQFQENPEYMLLEARRVGFRSPAFAARCDQIVSISMYSRVDVSRQRRTAWLRLPIS